MKMMLKTKLLAIAAASAAVLASIVPTQDAQAQAQAKEQFFPVLVYRTGPYGPNGTPFANGYVDYLKLMIETVALAASK
jgi:branched-chain amino acid transport system substrate-binding protein